MNSSLFLSYLIRRGVNLSISGHDLKIDAPRGILTNNDRVQLRERKAELIDLLSAPQASFFTLYAKADSESQEWLEVRAAIIEYDGNLTRQEAEAQAAREYQAQFRDRN